jgi:hypothetical protein
MTGQDLLSAAMRVAGVLAAGETAPSDEMAIAQTVANQMLESWSAERLSVFTLNRQTFSLVAGTASYTLGTGGAFNIPRPAHIEYVSRVLNSNPLQPLEQPLKLYTDEEWQGIPVKSITSSLPLGVYDDGGFPLRTLTYWPVPTDSTVQTILGVWAALTQFTDLNTDNTFPPGYIDAIKYNLAVRIAAEWPGSVTDLTIQLAKECLSRIKRTNVPIICWTIDPAMQSSGGHYDWRSDTYTK